MSSPDVFDVYRNALFIALTIYTIVVMAITIWFGAKVLAGRDPRKRLLRLYLSYQLLTIRVRPLAGELARTGFWTLALLGLWWLHHQI
ncbi:MAG: hypothetical protein JNG88_10740 [Phycisphaerales bacterium]|nr:hypothetical protein [Phycisphaerales bacterium]